MLLAVILVQAENEFDEGPTRSPYMQAVIDTYRANGIVVRASVLPACLFFCTDTNVRLQAITHNDKHSGQTGNFSPDRPGEGRVNIYCGDSYPQGKNRWVNPQSIYRSAHEAVAPSNPLCLAEVGYGVGVDRSLTWAHGIAVRRRVSHPVGRSRDAVWHGI